MGTSFINPRWLLYVESVCFCIGSNKFVVIEELEALTTTLDFANVCIKVSAAVEPDSNPGLP